MIERYALPEMRAIFSEARRLELWTRIELLAAEGWFRAGRIPEADWQSIQAGIGTVDADRMREIEQESQHDILAFLRALTEGMGAEGRWLHYGLTSSDVLDTATAVTLRDASEAVLAEVDALIGATAELARRHRSTAMVGRTHGIHAEPTTFGFVAAGWYAELLRDRERLAVARDEVAVGKISGAVGTHANVLPEVETWVCVSLGLTADPVATQVVSRDRHAVLLTTLAVLGGTLERIATDLRHLQRTEVGEAFEPFGAGQQGSSAMPHKRNPILGERVSGLARLLRGDALVGLENMALWHERDISHSAAERFVFERSLSVAAYACRTLASVIRGLEVDAGRMAANLDMTGGAIYSEAILLALVAHGVDRQEGYRLVQAAATRAREGGRPFRDEVIVDDRIGQLLSDDELARAMDLEHHLAGTAAAFASLGLGE